MKKYTLTFVSNYINHHQIPVSNELFKALGNRYTFIQTESVEAERVAMGWGTDFSNLMYLRYYKDDPELARQLIMNSDIVVFGGTDDESFIMPRLECGKPVIRYSERIYKTGRWKFISLRGLVKKYHDHTRFRNAQVYLLCAGAYVAGDFRLINAYPNKKYKWGYFPETIEYDIEKLIEHKRELTSRNDGKISMLWVGRFIEWKHPEMAIKLAKYLKRLEYKFHLNMIGGGELETQLKNMVMSNKLNDCVTFVGYKKPEEVRKYMEDSEIFISTSDQQEGWGAVLNEAMNSGCACIAGNRIGAAPYLIQEGVNGLLFKNKNQSNLNARVEYLLNDDGKRRGLATHAYETILFRWNASEAGLALMDICEDILEKRKPAYKIEGPGSKA